MENTQKKHSVKDFLKRKDIEISARRYGIDALGAMAQGLFASLLIGTIISTLGEQFGLGILIEIGKYAKEATGAAMAVAIGDSPAHRILLPVDKCSHTVVGVANRSLGEYVQLAIDAISRLTDR